MAISIKKVTFNTLTILFLVSTSLIVEGINIKANAQLYIAQRQNNCYQRVGPFVSIYATQSAMRYWNGLGYQTSNYWGQGGIVSNSQNRRYYFNVFYVC